MTFWCFILHLAAGGRVEEETRVQHSPPLVKLFENGMSKWTGAIFGILDVLLSLPGDKTFTQYTGRYNECQIKRQVGEAIFSYGVGTNS